MNLGMNQNELENEVEINEEVLGNKVDDIIASFRSSSLPKVREQKLDQAGRGHGVGKRKSSVAKAWVKGGNGTFIVNGKPVESYFPNSVHANDASYALKLATEKFDVIAVTKGGGLTGQSGALRLALSRALVNYNPEYYGTLRTYGLMTFDNRQVERKKAGLVKARKAKPTSRR